MPFTTLALGSEIKVPGIDGEETVKIPEGTQTGHDVPPARQGHAGRVGTRPRRLARDRAGVTPKKLTKEQKKLLEQLAATLPEQKVKPTARDDEDDGRGIFGKVKDIFG